MKITIEVDDTKLKPCPFCGGEGTVIIRKGKNGWRDRYAVLCDYEHGGCGSESGWYHYESEAIEAWNRRVIRMRT
jgi:Lar family restriction alleviation protein